MRSCELPSCTSAVRSRTARRASGIERRAGGVGGFSCSFSPTGDAHTTSLFCVCQCTPEASATATSLPGRRHRSQHLGSSRLLASFLLFISLLYGTWRSYVLSNIHGSFVNPLHTVGVPHSRTRRCHPRFVRIPRLHLHTSMYR